MLQLSVGKRLRTEHRLARPAQCSILQMACQILLSMTEGASFRGKLPGMSCQTEVDASFGAADSLGARPGERNAGQGKASVVSEGLALGRDERRAARGGSYLRRDPARAYPTAVSPTR